MVVTTVINSNNYDSYGLSYYMFAYCQGISNDDILTPKTGLWGRCF